jgi:hypothetical protein
MRAILAFVLLTCASVAPAQQRPPEIDPNTKIEGGADLRSSGANAGGGASTDDRLKTEKARSPTHDKSRIDERGNVAGPESDAEKDKPISERKPKQEEHERATMSP